MAVVVKITARRINDRQPAVITDDQIGIKYAFGRQGEHRTIGSSSPSAGRD